MAGLLKEGFLKCAWTPGLQFVRFAKRRVNVQRPRAPHYERARVLALLKPQYDWDLTNAPVLPTSETCKVVEEGERYKKRPDNPLEKILAKELKQLFDTKKLIAIVHTNPISGDDLFNARVKLKDENMKLEIYSKHVVRIALEGTQYDALLQLFVCHNAIIFGEEPRVDKMLKLLKKMPSFVLMAGIVEGRLLSVTQLQKYAALGDIPSAQAQLVATLNSAGSRLVSQLTQAQSTLVSQLNQIKEQKGQGDS